MGTMSPTSPTNSSITLPSPSHSPPSDDLPTFATSATTVPNDVREQWSSWTARNRLLGLRRWVLDLEWEEGTVETWSSELMSDWVRHRHMSFDGMDAWRDGYQRKIMAGRTILKYLSRVMDGALSGDLEAECRDLVLQVHQLGSPLYTAVAGLEVSLHWTQL